MKSVVLTVNRKAYQLEIEDKWTLLHVLREKLKLPGTKYGCGTNDCGACKVLVDGIPRNSCVLLAKNMEGKEIVTIEGVSDNGALHPVQQAFIDAGAIQCGFCTPGMVMIAVGLLNENPVPTDQQILDTLEGNLCRCTGYKKIVEAIRLASKYIADQR